MPFHRSDKCTVKMKRSKVMRSAFFQLVSAFLDSPLCRGLLKVLELPPPVYQETVNLIVDFLRLLTDIVGSVHNAEIVRKIVAAPVSRNKTDEHLISVYDQICWYIGKKDYNVLIANECVTLLADVLYYSACNGVPLPDIAVEASIRNLQEQEDLCKQRRLQSLVYDPIWCTLERKCRHLKPLFEALLAKNELDTADLFQLTTCFEFYTRSSVWPFHLRKSVVINRHPSESGGLTLFEISPPTPLRSAISVSKNRQKLHSYAAFTHGSKYGALPLSGYQVPCWQEGCTRCLSEWDLSAQGTNFFYCERYSAHTQ